jgi:GR25 family glycosyltransferase involved in LPS biosynthesis
MNKHNPILPIYAINLRKRADRRAHLLAEFARRPAFSLQIVPAIEDPFGALGLWKTICHILNHLAKPEDDFIIICEDDLQFTRQYTPEYLLESIALAKSRQADVLLGGVSWFGSAVQLSDHLFWVEKFSGLHFTVIFRKFFKTISEAATHNMDAADYQIASLTDNAMFMHPFIAVQKEFGYSDATPINNEWGRVTAMFKTAAEKIRLLKKVRKKYEEKGKLLSARSKTVADTAFTIPTYVINLPERKERLAHIQQQFKGRSEFDVTIVPACKHAISNYGLWLSIRKVIKLALKNDDDVIVICEDDHQFTKDYSRAHFLQQVTEAHEQGAYCLSGGTGRFEHAVPITENRFWVNHCLSAQFVVFYRPFFERILAAPFNERIVSDLAYPEMTSNKAVLYPFISMQRDFGYANATKVYKREKGIVARLFAESDHRMAKIQQAYRRYEKMNE